MKRSPIIYFLFFTSGITALVYEIVWTRMLTLVFGHTVFSVSVVLAAFMAGLGFGSYVWGATIDKTPKPLMVYGIIEILIAGSCAVMSLIFANFSPFYAWMHLWLPESPALLNFMKAALAFLLMFIPTMLMGATLPIVSRYFVTDDKKLGAQVGYLYALNTLGAAVGCLFTGFFLVSVFGVLQSVLGAAVINLLIGIGAIRIEQEMSAPSEEKFRFPKIIWPTLDWTPEQKLWMGVSFITGLTALAYEVLWTRLLVFSISSTVYSFSMMLAVFLLGIVLGSLLAVPMMKRFANLRTMLIILQCGIGLYVITSLYMMEHILSPPWNSYNLQNPAAAFARYFKDSATLMLLPTLFMGMTFPLLTKAISGTYSQVGRGTGQIYASNTAGAIIGSLAAGFWLLPNMGSEESMVLVATLNLLLALFLFASGGYATLGLRRGLTAILGLLILFIHLTIPEDLLDEFFMRDSAGKRSQNKLLYFDEGLTDTVAIFKDNYGVLDPQAKRLITNGISMSASNVIASRYMKLFAHVPILLLDDPEEVLVICFGTGQTTGAAGIHPRVKSVDSVDLSPGVVRAADVFRKENYDVINNPKVHIILQDGRNHLLTTRKLYDVITSEPPPPRTAFTVNLYTQDYYELTKKRLRPGGVVVQWVPLHSQSEKEVLMHFRTFQSVFPHTMAWLSVANEIMLIGSDQPIRIDFEKLQERIEDPIVKAALEEIEIGSVHSFLGNIWFLEDQIERLGMGRRLITDNRPSIEFYLDQGKVIGASGIEKLVFNRAPFDEIAERISHMPDADRKIFKKYYEALDLYQRGVMYDNRQLLLEAISMISDNDLFRYHLQGAKKQIERLAEEIEKDPDNVEVLLNLGHSYFQVGENSRSIDILNKVLKKQPGQSYAMLYLGYNYLETGNLEEAKKQFKTAVSKNPQFLRQVMQEIGLVELLTKLRQEPDNVGLINAAAQFYNIKNDYGQSIKYSQKVLDKDPANQQALQNMIFSYRGMGRPKEVLLYGRRYDMVKPDDIHSLYIMAEMNMKTLQYEKALPYLEKILKADDTYRNAQKLMEECRKALDELKSQGPRAPVIS